jgi:NAD(P)H dehydrogenase (quinone)
MQVMVMYFTRSGHTKALADAIADGVRQVEGATCVVRDAHEVTEEDMLTSQGIIVGSPVYFGTMAAEIKQTLDAFVHLREHMEGKVGAAFATSADAAGGRETTLISLLQCLLIYGMVVAGDPLDATGHYGVSCEGAPDATVLQNGQKLGRRVADLARKLAD